MANPTRIPPSLKPPERRSKPPISRQMIPAKGNGGLFNFGTISTAARADLKVYAFLGLMGENAEPPPGRRVAQKIPSVSVMKAAGKNSNLLRQDLVDQPMFLADTPGPAPGEFMS